MFVITLLLTLGTKLHCTHNIILVLLSFEDITYNIIDYRAVEIATNCRRIYGKI